MKPHSLQTVQLQRPSRAEQFKALGPHAARHGRYPKGTVLPETNVLACPRVKVEEFPEGFIPAKYLEVPHRLHNQLEACCRDRSTHEIEGRKSHPDEQAPDIYIFHCTCGRRHVRFLVGSVDDVPRPIWSA